MGSTAMTRDPADILSRSLGSLWLTGLLGV
jgi:hypothetical protein